MRQFETETRLACAPERGIRPIVTALPRIKAHQMVFTPNAKGLMVCCSAKVFVLSVQSRKCVQVLSPPEAYLNAAAGGIALSGHVLQPILIQGAIIAGLGLGWIVLGAVLGKRKKKSAAEVEQTPTMQEDKKKIVERKIK